MPQTVTLQDALARAKTARGRERTKALLSAAVDVFLERGYERASLDEIIARSGGSKSAVYALCGSKQGLFIAALSMMLEDVYEAYMAQYREGRSWREELAVFAEVFLSSMMKPRTIGCTRLVYAESAALPEVGRWYYQEAMQRCYHSFAKVLENSLPLPMEELEDISLHFVESLKARFFMKSLCLPGETPSTDELRREALACARSAQVLIEERLRNRP
ncbi:MAG: TetR/AcrR family transcriptional regulator [Duodenibacillus sp.]|nr:TetR/AcrR family transcriptional regulator [Duodenibacillus sp.]